MKAIFNIVIAILINTSVATFTFANNGNPAKGTTTAAIVSTIVNVVTVENNDATTEISAEMDAVLANLITNSTMTVSSTTMDNATIMTVTSNNEITISNSFALHTFGETLTSDDIAPAAAAMEVITLEVEEM